ncbi:MAG: XdhC/CoxI family protein [Lachnospiraceae bacterium]|nr:XdhC/CoxI family protein [Lachnospiraceae bacterium]
MIEDYYGLIAEDKDSVRKLGVTVLDGRYSGEHSIIQEGKCQWLSRPDGFLAAHQSEIIELSSTGIVTIDETRVYAEYINKKPHMVICGGGHVGVEVVRLARMVGFIVTMVEDRQEFADAGKAAGAGKALVGDYRKILSELPSDQDTYFVIVTRSHYYDRDCLREIARKPHAYIGMMGSKRRVKLVFETLEKEGVAHEVLAQVHSPIGLPIGSVTPEEIAVSIIAEIISIKNVTRHGASYLDEILMGVKMREKTGSMAMATVIAKKGSAPRDVGTKMLVFASGDYAGTVGGGAHEAKVMETAVGMIRNGQRIPRIEHYDMTNEDVEKDQSMICGGVMDILIEVI